MTFMEVTIKIDLSKIASEINDTIDDDNKKETPESLKAYINSNPSAMRQFLHDGLWDRLTD